MFTNNSDKQVKDKIIILHVLDSFGVPLTNEQTTEFILENDLINYFELQQYLTELVDSSMLEYSESEGEDYYLITDTGSKSLSYFKERISKSLRRFINDQVEEKKKRIIANTEISADYERLDENDYLVKLVVKENNSTLMELNLNIVSNKHAKRICDKWNKNAQYLYGDILNLLVSD